MASLTTTEFNDAVGALADHYGIERLRDKLADVGAFKSRKGSRRPTPSPTGCTDFRGASGCR